MKLIIQIPCYNEAKSLPEVVQSLPTSITGIDDIDIVIIDDGSSDGTFEVAKQLGVKNCIRFPNNKGLARAFVAGMDACLRLGADVIVNIDADNQYNAEDIESLVKPIVDGSCEIVIGERPIRESKEFSPLKKLLQRIGSWVVRTVSQTDIPDAPSGFRAFSREAALRMNIFNDYTYTLESIIQTGQKNMALMAVPIRVNKTKRPSRLIKSIVHYITKSVSTIVRIFVVYKPFAFFASIGALFIICGTTVGVRFLIYFFTGAGKGHVQSLILASILLVIGFQTMLVAFLADLLAVNRKLLEDIQYRLRRDECKR